MEASCCEYFLRIYPQRTSDSPQQYSFKQRRCQTNVSTLSSTHTTCHQSKGWKGDEEVRAIGTTRAYIVGLPQQTHPADFNEALKLPSFKTDLPTFLLNEWKEQAYAHIIHERHLYVGHLGECLHFFVEYGVVRHETIDVLGCNHAEADTRICLHTNASQETKLKVYMAVVLTILLQCICM